LGKGVGAAGEKNAKKDFTRKGVYAKKRSNIMKKNHPIKACKGLGFKKGGEWGRKRGERKKNSPSTTRSREERVGYL